MLARLLLRSLKLELRLSGLEFMERDALELGIQFLNDHSLILEDNIEAHLLVEVDGSDLDLLYKDCEAINNVLENFDCGEILFADSAAQKEKLWKLRRCIRRSSEGHSVYKEEDTVVPRAELPTLLKRVKDIGRKYGFRSVCYGHAGDGNLHVNILKGDMADEVWDRELPKGITEIFELCARLGGTISGEHGIGFVQRDYLPIVFSGESLRVQKGIKSLLDPKGIMNPGKIFSA